MLRDELLVLRGVEADTVTKQGRAEEGGWFDGWFGFNLVCGVQCLMSGDMLCSGFLGMGCLWGGLGCAS